MVNELDDIRRRAGIVSGDLYDSDLDDDDETPNNLDDFLFDNYRGNDIRPDVYENRRTIELVVEADDLVTVEDMQAFSQTLSNLVTKFDSSLTITFRGIQGGSSYKIGLVFTY